MEKHVAWRSVRDLVSGRGLELLMPYSSLWLWGYVSKTWFPATKCPESKIQSSVFISLSVQIC